MRSDLEKTTYEQMECAQINISGGTATVSPTTYSIPGIYAVSRVQHFYHETARRASELLFLSLA